MANEADIRMCKVIDERHLIQMVKTTQFLKELDVNRCRCRVVWRRGQDDPRFRPRCPKRIGQSLE